MNRQLLGWGVVAALTLVSCRDTTLRQGACREDKDCGEPARAYRCETQTGVCYCRTDEACQARELCNAAGFCQDRAGCETNDDCGDSSLFCDTTTATCLPVGRCSIDLQCELGQVCDVTRSTCVPGCRTSGDCPGSSCRCGNGPCTCSATTPADLAKCQVGVCDSNFCADNTFCRFGELCGAQADAGTTADGGAPLSQCYSDYDSKVRPYCDNCTVGAGVSVCGTGANYCLIDTQNPGNYFCGADCSEGQACPRGFECSDVIVVFTQWSCNAASPSCPANPRLTCQTDADCARGGTCSKLPGATVGNCVGQCAVGEGDQGGFCTCQEDADCAQETCSRGECSISRKKCNQDGDCKSIKCVDFNGVGGCLIGSNCAPANGLSCVQIGRQ